jgi:prephenate dehydrogenase
MTGQSEQVPGQHEPPRPLAPGAPLPAESDSQESPPLVGIVGGKGQMGRWFARFFAERGCEVLVSDRDTTLTNGDLAARCAIVVVCVPIRVTPAVLQEVVAAAGRDTLVVSTASLMMLALPQLRRAQGEALCLHPLFGPMTAASGQIAVNAPVRHGPRGRWLVGALTEAGILVRDMTPEEHDRAMASVQVMQHACFVAFANALASSDLVVPAALGVATPTFRLFLALAARILSQDAGLYGDIVTLNPHASTALGAFQSALAEVRATAESCDAAAFERLFARARAYFEAAPAAGAALIADAEHSLLDLP